MGLNECRLAELVGSVQHVQPLIELDFRGAKAREVLHGELSDPHTH